MVIGHQQQRHLLSQIAESGKIAHGFLFFGPRALGKKKIALEFVKSINCKDRDIEKGPCQKCYSCQGIEKLLHPDFLLIQHQDKEIKISQIRDLGRKLSLRPSQFSFKTAIIDEAHLMNLDAQAALLKTLEEPSGNAILILVTEHPEMLSLAIRSRVQRIKFGQVAKKTIEEYLAAKGLAIDEIGLISLLSLGRPGIAIDLSQNKEKLKQEAQTLKDLAEIIGFRSGLSDRFQYAKRISQESKAFSKNKEQENNEASLQADRSRNLLESWLIYFRESLFFKMGLDSYFNANSEALARTRELTKRYSLGKIIKIINTIQDTFLSLATTNVSHRLALEIMMLEL